jgi:hypothetical protein
VKWRGEGEGDDGMNSFSDQWLDVVVRFRPLSHGGRSRASASVDSASVW